jgi:tetratricopeptide (TPR) repeat protein
MIEDAKTSGEILQLLSEALKPEDLKSTKHTSSGVDKSGIDKYSLVAKAFYTGFEILRTKFPNSIEVKEASSLLDVAAYWEKQAEAQRHGILRNEISDYNKRGHNLVAEGRYEDALVVFDEALDKANASEVDIAIIADSYMGKGTAYFNLNQLDKAIKCYKKVLEFQPNFSDAWYNLGLSLRHLNKYLDAIECYDKAIRINPYDYLSWRAKGSSLYFLEKYDEADICFERAMLLNPKDHISYYNKGVNLAAQRRYREAKRYYKAGLKLRPDSLSIKSNLAEIYLLLKEVDKSRALSLQVLTQTQGQEYEFAMRILVISSLYLQNNVNAARENVVNILNYYEYITCKETKARDRSLTGWNFDKWFKMIEAADISHDVKTLLSLLVTLSKAKDPHKRDILTKDIMDLIEATPEDGFDIRVTNTSSEIKDRPGWFDWEIHLETADKNLLSSIDHVKYTLHPTFKHPIRVINERVGGFILRSNGWGEFRITVEINLKNNKKFEKYHWLKLSGPTSLDKTSSISVF